MADDYLKLELTVDREVIGDLRSSINMTRLCNKPLGKLEGFAVLICDALEKRASTLTVNKTKREAGG